MKDHEVAEGECFSSIAFENGFFWRTLWEHEKNAGLKAKTRSPFVLEPGSVVHVPELRPKEEACATGKRHRFRRKGVPEVLNILFAEGGEPLAGVPFVLVIDGKETRGKTDGEGRVRQWLARSTPTCGRPRRSSGCRRSASPTRRISSSIAPSPASRRAR
jgi:N-acetylmuramoyl-L-alanine amidase